MSRIVLPGDKLADVQLRIENALLEGGKTYATVPGLFDDANKSFIPLEAFGTRSQRTRSSGWWRTPGTASTRSAWSRPSRG